ncbi:fatty acyl- reductase 3-like isoform X1 [Olea europaea subsp. europaea]|uniref:Fatty acyl-CoA reductase n=1 Tax=Olea europaea subsp. europaea TaxID=158383 RepID=A0A8S0QGU5_OLEEU|nr:fatty acyl- reductase 3-like isoform X1 [Olea europaea subsp. europaea]
MEESKILQYFEGKTILITGATGFLAKIFLEKVLRVQPKIKKLFLLIRAVDKRSAELRLHDEVLNTGLFGILKAKYGADLSPFLLSKVIPVCGDVSYENLGIFDSKLRDEISQEVDIIVNSAATTKFDERYDVAMGINALGAMHVQKFARNCSTIEMFVHVSTAYVHGSSVGIVPEKPFRMGETLDGAEISYLDINTEKKIVEERLRGLEAQNATELKIKSVMRNLGIERAKLHGWPNTYVFTKAMGEMLLEKLKENVKLIIVRPTIITSTYKEPFSGWTESIRTLDSIFVGYGKGKIKFFVGDPDSILDMIPGDMVVNSMLVAMAMHTNQPSHRLIYHIGSSRRNPLKYADMKWLMYRYLTKNPLLDTGGKPIKVEEAKILETMASFHRYIAIHYLPFIQMLKLANMILCNHFEHVHVNARRRVNHSIRLAELYKPYLFFQGMYVSTFLNLISFNVS